MTVALQMHARGWTIAETLLQKGFKEEDDRAPANGPAAAGLGLLGMSDSLDPGGGLLAGGEAGR